MIYFYLSLQNVVSIEFHLQNQLKKNEKKNLKKNELKL